MKKPNINDNCLVQIESVLFESIVVAINDIEEKFNARTLSGRSVLNIPFSKFRPLYQLSVDPTELLWMFWQRKSDGNKYIECSEEMDAENVEFKNFVKQFCIK